MSAAQSRTAMAADSVDFVDEDDTGRVLFALLEEVADAACANADEHLHEVGTGNRKERNVGFAGDRASKQGLARAWRSHEQNPLGDASSELLEFLRILQKVDDLIELFLGFIDAGHVFEGGFLLLGGEKTGARFTEAERFVTASLHLPHHENPDPYDHEERRKRDDDAQPVGFFDLFIVKQDALVLQCFGNVGDGGVRNCHAAEFAAVAVLALKLGAVGRQIHRHILDVPALHLREEVAVVRLVLARRRPAFGGHLPKHSRQRNHHDPK